MLHSTNKINKIRKTLKKQARLLQNLRQTNYLVLKLVYQDYLYEETPGDLSWTSSDSSPGETSPGNN